MEVKLLHPWKQSSPKEKIDGGIVTEVKLLHSSKKLFPNLFTNGGIVTEVKLLQREYLLLVDYQYYTL